MDIAGKVAIVTGGSSGIGQAMVLRLASLGARVLVADVDDEGGRKVAEQAGGEASFLRVDVGEVAQVQALVAHAVRHYGRLDILHNNAGIMSSAGEFATQDMARMESVVRINLIGLMAGTQAALGPLSETRGVIANTASVSGLRPWREDPVYSATKAAVVFFTQAMAGQLKPRGIRINAVCPGIVRTPLLYGNSRLQTMTAAQRAEFEASLATFLEPAEVVDALIEQIQDETRSGEARYLGRAPLPPEGKVMRGLIP